MDDVYATLAVAIAVGLVQLSAGVVIGRYFPWKIARSGDVSPAVVRQIQAMIARMQGDLGHVARDVDAHRDRIAKANAALEELPLENTGLDETTARQLLDHVAEIVDANERLQYQLALAEDRLRHQSEQIQSHLTEARTDPLTELPNRRVFEEQLTRQLAFSSDENPSWLLLLDIDHFKLLNDRYGHQCGDDVLRGLAGRLRESAGPSATVARIGGEEFAVIVPHCDATESRHITEAMRFAVASHPLPVSSGQVHVSISLGLAKVTDGDAFDDVYRRADEALYSAKRRGRNCGFFHDGVRCRQICPGDGPAVASIVGTASDASRSSSPGHSVAADASEFLAEASDLRVRLSEVVEGTP
jgi:diguanylate cyclase (GGDEF)-like protein